VNDSNLNDIGLLDSTIHVRHAMALFEKRDQLCVERFHAPNPEVRDKHEHSFQEAWFAGSHGNLGGACEEDGLALWPLQWIVSEAENHGLVLGFNRMPNSQLEDPARLIFPKDTGGVREIDCANGIKVRMWSLTPMMRTKGFFPLVDSKRSTVFITTTSDRDIFSNGVPSPGKLIGYDPTGKLYPRREITFLTSDYLAPSGTFIHPSVFLLDETVASMANIVNSVPYCEALRSQVSFSIPNSEQDFWNIHKEIAARKEIRHPRIVVCGLTEVGKSTLINAALGKKMV
jgi:T6SS, Phospholipase effector Tle1-like, catalytic domain